MFDFSLFLGFKADAAFDKALQQTNPYLVSLFIGKEEYLQEITSDGVRYLGKCLPSFPSLEHIENVEKHVISLLKQVAPHYSFNQNPPLLLTLHEPIPINIAR